MAKSVETSSQRKPAPTGVLYIYHALAFSTLLSSQETDAHRVPNFRSSLGATLLIYPVFPSCQIGAGSQLIEPVRQIGFSGIPEPSAYSLSGSGVTRTPSTVEACLLVAPRVQDRHPAFPPPRGKKNLTGPSHHRQIVPEIF